MTLKISVETFGMQTLRLIVRDSEQANTELTNRTVDINGRYDFFVRMPLCRNYVDIILVNDADGSDSSFKYLGFKKQHLVRRLDVIDFTKYNLNSYIKFVQKFCYNAGVIRTNNRNDSNDFYTSDDWVFFIKYLPIITDYVTGEEIPTPCRISIDNGLIEISQKHFVPATVPGRMASLFHEFAHPHMNLNPDDETEADLNGLIIYLGLGYPRIDAGIAWCDIFMDNPTPENEERMYYIRQFIDDFENNKKIFF